jgi:flagellar basal-body rod modification protein FlgD
MAISAIGNINSDLTPADPARIPVQALGQQDFIKILVTQLTSQDPLEPQKDSEFIGQMAQFSTLQNSNAMKDGITSLQSQQEFLKANSLIGRNVELLDDDANRFTGAVTAVQLVSGQPQIIVDEKPYRLDEVVRVWQNAAPQYQPAYKAPEPSKTPTQAS